MQSRGTTKKEEPKKEKPKKNLRKKNLRKKKLRKKKLPARIVEQAGVPIDRVIGLFISLRSVVCLAEHLAVEDIRCAAF